jgi:hypothetical protein
LISLIFDVLLALGELVRVNRASEKRPEAPGWLGRKEIHNMSKIFAVLPVALLAFACGGGEATPEAAAPEAPAEAAPPAEGGGDAAAAPADGAAAPAEGGDAKPAEGGDAAKPAEPAK